MYVLIYVFISKYCQYYSDFIRCQAKLVHTIFIYIVLVLFISFQRPRPEIQELYIRYIYYIYIIYIRSKCTLLLQHFKFYLFLLFSITPPPLSSFDLLFWLGGGGGRGCKKFVSTRALLGANKKKFLIPGGEYNRYL